MRKKQPSAMQKKNSELFLKAHAVEKWVLLRSGQWRRVILESPDSYLVEEGEGWVRVDKSEVKDKEVR